MLIVIIFIVLIAIITGFISGLLGVGGNVVAIPLLLIIFTHYLPIHPTTAMHLAIGTAVIVMVFTTLSSVIAHHNHHNIDWRFYRKIAPAMVVGAIIGAYLALLINGSVLEKIFGIFLVIMGIKLLHSKFQHRWQPQVLQITYLSGISGIILGFVIGFKSGLLGIGGGAVIIPLMLYLNYQGAKISGTTSVCSFTMATTSAITFLVMGNHVNYHLAWSFGNIYLPAVITMIPLTMILAKIGARTSNHLKHSTLTTIQIILMLGLGIKMLI